MKQRALPERKRKALILLPLIAIPLLTLAFWAMGGGGQTGATTVVSSGLNLQLPEAQLKTEKDRRKLHFYEVAEQDSLKKKEAAENDPYRQDTENGTPERPESLASLPSPYDPVNGAPTQPDDLAVQRIYQQLEVLNRQVSAPPPTAAPDLGAGEDGLWAPTQPQPVTKEAIAGPDPELAQLDGMMEKILDIQHPRRVREEQAQRSLTQKGKVFPVTALLPQPVGTYIGSQRSSAGDHAGFFSIPEQIPAVEQNAIEALVPVTQNLTDGSAIRLRIRHPVFINGMEVPAGTFVWGRATLEGERLQVAVEQVRTGSMIYNVQLHVHDIDGMPGLYIPGTITGTAAKEAAEDAVQQLEIGALDGGIRGQATALGASTIRTLLRRKTKAVKIRVKAGYSLLLLNQN